MVTHNMMRTHKGKYVKNILFVTAYRTNQKPNTGQITEIAPYVRIYF